jgi:RecB family exonuclease
VCFYGFDDLTALQLDALETLSRVVDAPVTLSLAYEPGRLAFAGRATTFQMLAPLAAEHVALEARAEYYAPASRGALHHLERSLLVEEPGAPAAPGDAVRLLEGGGERAELELVAGEIRALLDDGVPAEEIAVVLRSPGPAAPLLSAVFGAARIPFAVPRRIRLADTGAGRALCALLRCVADDGDGAALLAWLRASSRPGEAWRVDALEARARAAGLTSVAGLSGLWEADAGRPPVALERLAAAAERGPVALLSRVDAELQRLLSAPWRRAAPLLSGPDADEAAAVGAARRALSELRDCARAARELSPDLRSLSAVLGELECTVGALPETGVVAVVDPLALRARRVRALFLCGLQEGVFPAAPRPEPFLGEDDRRELARASGLRLGPGDDVGAERYLLYACVSRPEELLCLSWHVADDDGAPAAPSSYLDEVRSLFDAALWERRRRRALGAADWPGPGEAPPGWAARHAPPAGPRSAPAPIQPLRHPDVLARLAEAPWSPSGLEAWISCPARWFVERLLRADDLEPEPEPLARGSVLHDVLETTHRRLREETGSARLQPDRLELARALMRDALAALLAERRLTARPEREAAARRRLEVDLERFLDHGASAGSPWEPSELELSFGFEDDPHEALALDEGVRVRGRVDRVDVSPEGEAIVFDYKGRGVPDPARWVTEGRVQIAVYMLAVERLLGRRVVGGFYQPTSGRDLRPRGALVADRAPQLATVNGDRREAEAVEDLVEATLALARRAAAEGREGRLEARPRTCAFGGGCSFPAICRCLG